MNILKFLNYIHDNIRNYVIDNYFESKNLSLKENLFLKIARRKSQQNKQKKIIFL